MAAKPKKLAASAKSSSSSSSTATKPTTTSTTTAASAAQRRDTNSVPAPAPAAAAAPATRPAQAAIALSSSFSISPSLYKERPTPTSTKVLSGDLHHRPNQPFQGGAQLRQVQQSPNLSTGQQQQSPYAGQGVFNSQAGVPPPYLNNPQQYQQQQQQQQQQQSQPQQQQQQQQQHQPTQHPQANEGHYYQPSPRSTTSGGYYQQEKSEPMATATATMQRPSYAQLYGTPQSSSPVSVTSPQTHDHGRPLYPHQTPTMPQPMYGYGYHQPMGPPYPTQHHQSHVNTPSMLQYQPPPSALPQSTIPSQSSTIPSSPRIKDEIRPYSQTPQTQPGHTPQRQPLSVTPQATTPQLGQPAGPIPTASAAPGPIPATTPLVVRQDSNGVQWISFEYSRDRVKMEYLIRCDVESVDSSQLDGDFKTENCVYPRACVPKEQYKGNRLAYETDCNQVGWALAELNPCLRGKRGLIQRAVDSWRNSNHDPRLRSRRVRRQNKIQNRAKAGALTSQTSVPGSATTGLPGQGAMGVTNARAPGKIPPSSQQVHRPSQHEISSSGQESMAGNMYTPAANIHRPGSTPQQITSPTELRQAQTFPSYQAYPSAPTTMGPSMTPLQGGLHVYGRPGGHTTMAASRTNDTFDKTELCGDVPEAKRRKFLQVYDHQNNATVRIRVSLHAVDTSEVPDSFRKQNSVFPRSYFPTMMQPASQSTSSDRFTSDDIEEMDDGPPVVGRVAVPCHLPSGEGSVEISKLPKGKRDRERKINELGYRMAWGQSRHFAGRPIFLGRALDEYRTKQCKLLSEVSETQPIPSHLEVRPGKRRWLERVRQMSLETAPPTSS